MSRNAKKDPRNRKRKPDTKFSEKVGGRILIVCEGEKTEINYFKGCIRKLDLNSVKIEDNGSSSAPISVVKFAKEKKKEAENEDIGEYKEIYCVIDKDSHASFNDACQKIKGNNFIRILSIPCIEYWFLLHFVYSRSPFDREGNKSSCDICAKELKKHIPNYKKNMENLFSLLSDKLKTAKKNAKDASKDAEDTSEDNPSTEIHLLIEELEKRAEEEKAD